LNNYLQKHFTNTNTYIYILLTKQQFVITHAIRQTEILALLDNWVKNTPSVHVVYLLFIILLLFLWVGLAEIPPTALQPSRPFVLQTFVFGSSVHLQRRSMPESMRDLCERKEEVWARNGRSNLARQSDFHIIAGFFNMPQNCNMGQTTLLPLRRHAGNFVARKIRRLRSDLNPQTLPDASTLTTRPPKPLMLYIIRM
jgi:hypothetical protein